MHKWHLNRERTIYIISISFVSIGIVKLIHILRYFQHIQTEDILILTILPTFFIILGIFLFLLKEWARIGTLVMIWIYGLINIIPTIIGVIAFMMGNFMAIVPPVLYYLLIFVIYKFFSSNRTIILFRTKNEKVNHVIV